MQTIKYVFILSTGLLIRNAAAQNYNIDWHKVSGGGAVSANGQYAINGTIGQHDAGGAMAGEIIRSPAVSGRSTRCKRRAHRRSTL